MENEFKRLISEAAEIKASGKWNALNQKIQQLVNDNNGYEEWEIQVLANLCFHNFSGFFALKKAYDDIKSEPSLLAWRARNLLEISVWSIYCAKDTKNARIFYEEAGRDVKNIYEALIKWGEGTSQDSNWLDPIKAAKADISAQATSEGIESLEGAYKQVSKVAEECGIGQHFKVDYKMLSKFAHPTAMLILSTPDEEKEKLQKDMFYSQGCMYFVGGFNALEGVLSVMVEHSANS
jgi:hypothetical protein